MLTFRAPSLLGFQAPPTSGHAHLFIAGRDIVDILKVMGLHTADAVREYLVSRHPLSGASAPTVPAIDLAFPEVDVRLHAPPVPGNRAERPAAGDPVG